MAIGQFTQTPTVPVYTMVRHSGTIEDLQTELDSAFNGNFQLFEDERNLGSVFVIHNGQLVMVVPPDWWVGFNFGVWTANPDSDMRGAVEGGYTPYTPVEG